MTLRKRENAVNWKRKRWIAFCGELACERGYGPVVRQEKMNDEWTGLFRSRISTKLPNVLTHILRSQEILYLIISCLICTSVRRNSDVYGTLKMDAWGAAETLVKTHKTGWFHGTQVAVTFRGPVFKFQTRDSLFQWWTSWFYWDTFYHIGTVSKIWRRRLLFFMSFEIYHSLTECGLTKYVRFIDQ